MVQIAQPKCGNPPLAVRALVILAGVTYLAVKHAVIKRHVEAEE